MKERPAVALLTAAAAAATLFAWMRRRGRQRARDRQLQQIRTTVEQNFAETRLMHRHLRRLRGAVNQMHQYLNPPVPKGVKKPASETPHNKRPNLPDPAVPQTVASGTGSNSPRFVRQQSVLQILREAS
jgi:type II secretory pathway pseudopilin PulG